jgi:hypothetical protein
MINNFTNKLVQNFSQEIIQDEESLQKSIADQFIQEKAMQKGNIKMRRFTKLSDLSNNSLSTQSKLNLSYHLG